MNNSDDERRLRHLLDRATPDLGGIDPREVRARALQRQNGSRLSRYAAIAAAVVVVAGIALAIPLARNAGPSSHPAAAPSRHSSATPNTTATDRLAELTKNVPCPMTLGNRPAATRAELEHFHAVAALRCDYTVKTLPDQGEWGVTIRRATATGIDAMVRAFDQPDQTEPPPQPTAPNVGNACDLVGTIWPQVLLVDAKGDYLIPPMAVDWCGHPLPGVGLAINDSVWQTLSERKAAQQTSASGCVMRVKNMPYVVTQTAKAPDISNGGPVLTFHPDATLKVCIYRAPASNLWGGTFVRSTHLDSAESTKLRHALDGAGPAADATCPGQRDFATITAEGGGTVYLELGGCWRLQRTDANGHESLGTASYPAVVEELLKIG